MPTRIHRIKLPPPDHPLRFDVEGLIYVLGEEPNLAGGRVLVRVTESETSKRYVGRDRVDLFAFKSRQRFAGIVADACSKTREEVMGHLAVILDEVERRNGPQEEPTEELTNHRRAAALDFLQDPDLLERVVEVMGVGYVGEERNKALVYLVATGRLLDKPPSALILASSGSGKSELLDAVTRLMPPEEVRELSRITKSALHYAEPNYLRHKLVVVDEQEGSADADHAIRVLQSKGELSNATTSGGQFKSNVVRGPIALLSGTTSTNLNPENLSRCLELCLDDSPEQTRRIHEAQRRAWSGAEAEPEPAILFHDAQRLLNPLQVVIPFAEVLTFPARTTHDRRGNLKLLSLVAAHALLYQHQRERDARGRVVATPEDYAAVHDLLKPVLAHQLEGLGDRAARAYELLHREREPRTRRELSALLGWSYNTVKSALQDLVDQELAIEIGTDRPLRYRVLQDSPLGGDVELLTPEDLHEMQCACRVAGQLQTGSLVQPNT